MTIEPLPVCCLSCRFWKAGTTPAFPTVDGTCRRHAPQGTIIGSHTSGWQIFPPTNRTDWCGEYQKGAGLSEAWAAAQQIEKDAA